MGIIDGQRVRALESNAAWASKQNDNTFLGVQELANAGSGPSIANTQQKINDLQQEIIDAETLVTTLEGQLISLQGQVATLESLDTFVYVGQWDASLNDPSLADGDGGAGVGVGAVYRVSVAGSQDLGSGSISFNVGDKVVYNLTGIWEKWDVTDEPGSQTKTEYRIITNTEDMDEELELLLMPFDGAEVKLDVIGGGPQFYGYDFMVTDKALSWSGLNLSGILSEGDRVRITYTY
jgi:hypothetical protein